LSAFPAELGGGGMKDDELKGLGHVDGGAAAMAVDGLGREFAVELAGNVAAGAADAEDGVGALAHAGDVFGRALRAREMEVGELGDGVASAFVNRAADFSALNVDDADVHVSGGDGGGERLVAVADDQYHVGLEPVELAGKLDHAEADGLGHGGG